MSTFDGGPSVPIPVLRLVYQKIKYLNFNGKDDNLKFGDGDGPNLCRVKKVDLRKDEGGGWGGEG